MARPQGVFLIFDICDILEIVDKAKELLKQGKTMMEYADSGTSVTKQFPMDINQVLIEARCVDGQGPPEIGRAHV